MYNSKYFYFFISALNPLVVGWNERIEPVDNEVWTTVRDLNDTSCWSFEPLTSLEKKFEFKIQIMNDFSNISLVIKGSRLSCGYNIVVSSMPNVNSFHSIECITHMSVSLEDTCIFNCTRICGSDIIGLTVFPWHRYLKGIPEICEIADKY